MYLVISEEYLEKLLADQSQPGGDLPGQAVDDGKVVRLLDYNSPKNTRLGRWTRGDLPAQAAAPGELLLVAKEDELALYRADFESQWQGQDFERLRFYDDYQSRLGGLFDTSLLSGKTVAVIGLGTGGSIAAVELAKAGIGNLRLADFDRLKVHNLVRHVCGLSDLGRYKTEALKDYLLNVSPILTVETYNMDVTEDPDRLDQLLEGCDLVIGATDSEEAKAVINRAAWHKQIPVVYGAAYEMGFGGDIFLSRPGQLSYEGRPYGCYYCFRLATSELFEDQPHDEIGDYGSPRPQPALSMDVGIIALIMARAALSVLLDRDPTTRLQAYPANWILWGNQPRQGWIFDEPLQSRFVEVEAVPECPVCGQDFDPKLAAEENALVESLPEPARLPSGLSEN